MTDREKEEVSIALEEYRQLKKDAAKLQALESGGVDNWEWYYDSLRDYYVDPFNEPLYED